jgi:hypothetical protein
MAMSKLIKQVGIILASTILAGVAQAQLATEVVAERQNVRVGDPIRVSVSVTNQSAQALEVDGNGTAFDCFEVSDPDGQRLPYVGSGGMVRAKRATVAPFSTVMITKALDLTDKYVFDRPGRYSVRFNQPMRAPKREMFPFPTVYWLPSGSRAITIEVTAGQLSELDQVIAALLPIRPKGWRVAKAARGEVVPSGRSRVPGFAVDVYRSLRVGESVPLSFTKAEAKLDPNSEVRGTSEYMGRMRGFFVYCALDNKTRTFWPTVTEDICRALQIRKQ